MRSPKLFFVIVLCAVLAALRFACHVSAANPRERPNIIFMMADDMGWGMVDFAQQRSPDPSDPVDAVFAGHPELKTPELDAMRQAGLKFNRMYSQSPVCSPTRAAFVTGRAPRRLSVDAPNDGKLMNMELTIYEIAKTQGYTTGHFGKWHLGTLTKTNSFLFHYAPDTGGMITDVQLSFDDLILGVIGQTAGLNATDDLFAFAAPAFSAMGTRGSLAGEDDAISPDGRTLTIAAEANATGLDQLRIFTRSSLQFQASHVPEPATLALLASALLAMLLKRTTCAVACPGSLPSNAGSHRSNRSTLTNRIRDIVRMDASFDQCDSLPVPNDQLRDDDRPADGAANDNGHNGNEKREDIFVQKPIGPVHGDQNAARRENSLQHGSSPSKSSVVGQLRTQVQTETGT